MDRDLSSFTVRLAMVPSVSEQPERRWSAPVHWMALLATVFTWPLLFAGGLVTTYRVGMAVPDWPTTFGINMFLYDMSSASWGVKVEHFHRLAGAAVGIFTILMLVGFFVAGKGYTLRLLGLIALLGVIAQGVLGGVRVRLNSTFLASLHGCTGQLFFAYMVFLCVLTGRSFSRSPLSHENVGKLRFRALSTLLLIYLQVIAGAWLRHFPSEYGVGVHLVLGIAVASHVIACGVRTEKDPVRLASLIPASRMMSAILLLQLMMGFGAWWLLRPFDGIPRDVTSFQALIRTGHQANAALLLASAAVYATRTFLEFQPGVTSTESVVGGCLSVSRSREAVA